jgi:hypothetical protein
MKKAIFLLIMFLFGYRAYSQVNVSIPVDLTSSTGTNIEVPINVGDLTGKNIYAFQFKVTFNSSILNVTDIVTSGTLSGSSGWSALPNTSTPGEIVVGGFGASPLTGSGVLIKIKFSVVGSSGNTDLNIASFLFNSGTPSVTTTNGRFTVLASQVPVLIVTPLTAEVATTAGSTSFNVSNSGTGAMAWSASITSGSEWLTFNTAASGSNSGTLGLTYSQNSGTTSRTGKVLVTASGATGSPKEIVITQAGKTVSNQIIASMPSNLTGPKGQEILVPVAISDLTGKDVISYQLKVTFNSQVLQAVDVVTSGTLCAANGWSALANTTTPGEITVGAFGSGALTGSGDLIKLKFNVIGNNNATSSLTFSSFMLNSGSPTVTTTNGSFSVLEVSQPVLLVSPDSQNVSDYEGNASVSVSNSGTGTMAWSSVITEGSGWVSIASGANGTNSGTINFGYSKNSTSSRRTARITITASGAVNSPKIVVITQDGNDYPKIQVSTDRIEFDSTIINTTSEKTFKLTNTGTQNLIVSQIQFDGAFSSDFSYSAETLPMTVNPSVEKTLTVKFKPTDIGSRYAQLTVISNDPHSSSDAIILIGNGKIAPVDIPQPVGVDAPGTGTDRILRWRRVINAASYQLQISGTADFLVLILDKNITDTSYTVTTLPANSAFFWRVRAQIGSSVGAWSGAMSFTTIPQTISKANLLFPSNKANGQPTSIVFKWNKVSQAESYSLQISKDSLFTVVIRESSGITDTTKAINGLDYNTVYYWHVNSKAGSKESDWSGAWLFQTVNRAPSAFNLLQPSSSGIVQLTSPVKPVQFSWNKSIDPDPNDIVKYSLFILIPDFNITKNNLTDNFTSMDIMGLLKPGTTYKWYVTATDGNSSVYSDTLSFKTSQSVTGVKGLDLLAGFSLSQNYPNPFNPETKLEYAIPEKSYVVLKVFNCVGLEIETLVSGWKEAGIHSFNWEPHNLPSGVYFYKIQTGKFSESRKMIYLR